MRSGNFVDTILGRTECRAPAEDGLDILRILMAVYESARTGHGSPAVMRISAKKLWSDGVWLSDRTIVINGGIITDIAESLTGTY